MRIPIVALALLALLAATTAAPAAQAGTLALEVYLHEFSAGLHLVPDSMNANVGDTLKLTVHNQGTEHSNGPHWLMVCGDGPRPPSIGDDCKDKWGFTGMLQNNQTGVLTATAKKAGTFSYYCPIPGHADAGMVGTLTVQGNGSASSGGKSSPGTAILGSLIALGVVALVLRKVRS